MTLLIGGSILLIAGSAIALAFGWVTSDESLIWTSIAASVGAAVLLALAYNRSRAEVEEASAGAPQEPAANSPGGVATQVGGFSPAASTRPETPAPTRRQRNLPDGEVVAIPERKKFHRLDCRYAKSKGGERMSKSAARRRAYEPCGVCKP
ncbi:MAG: GlsB/YeaQ/YmgE family stress response membrane protein [Actinomycetota bacterium]